jgi:threonylcarbamoyladenosine tRNA methylthiotransferase MtaB
MNQTSDTKQPTVALSTLGCKVNQYETASFQTGFAERGLSQVNFSQAADIYVINTCAVTAKAGAQSRQLIRKALRSNPAARFVVTGCYAQIAAKEIRKLVNGPVTIIGNNNKHQLVEKALTDLTNKNDDQLAIQDDIRSDKNICQLEVRRFGDRTRAFLKVQDGCNNFCSYCIVPYARGRSRSQQPVAVVRQAEIFAREGYKEVVLTGIHVGDYGRDLTPAGNLLDLLPALVERTPEVRFRISSLEPTEITPELLRYMASTDNLMPHLHIPLQSGDNHILKKMNRRYTVEDFKKIVQQAQLLLPDIAIGVDVLVGFPGENEHAFANTLQLLEELEVAYLHVFPYSIRPGTVAADMAGQVTKKIKDVRVALLRELDHKKRITFYSRQLGTERRVLAEAVTKQPGQFKGFTENYIPVCFAGPSHLANQLVRVRLEHLDGRTACGVVQEQSVERQSRTSIHDR